MTQRLVAALIEDRANPSLGADGDRNRELSSSRAASLSHVKSLSFESRVREELREQGILDGDEAPKVRIKQFFFFKVGIMILFRNKLMMNYYWK